MAFLDLNLIKKRMAAGEPFVTCSESLTKMYRSRQNMEIPYIRNGVDVSQYTKRNCNEIDDVRKKLDLPLEKNIYVYSGGFIDRKNQKEAITAFLAMKKNADAVLLLLGDGTNFEVLKDEFSKNTNILFRGKDCLMAFWKRWLVVCRYFCRIFRSTWRFWKQTLSVAIPINLGMLSSFQS